MPSRQIVKLLGRPDCHLCDEARSGLEQMRASGIEFEVEEVNIESDDELFKRYLERIPVIRVGDRDVCELFIDRDAITAHIANLS